MIANDKTSLNIVNILGSKYYITTATSAEQYCWSFIEKLIADSKRNCQIENKTQERAIVSVQGPKRLVALGIYMCLN